MSADPSAKPLDRSFFDRDPILVARALLGKYLIAVGAQGEVMGRIVETEAYLAAGDSACHASRGMTRRNASMFGPPGYAYVYPIHSRYCFNVVTEPEGTASAVLIRAVEPLWGQSLMAQRRNTEHPLQLCRGPARLCEAFGLDRTFDGCDLTASGPLWIADAVPLDDSEIDVTPRIGVTSAFDLPLRFCRRECRYVSRSSRIHKTQ